MQERDRVRGRTYGTHAHTYRHRIPIGKYIGAGKVTRHVRVCIYGCANSILAAALCIRARARRQPILYEFLGKLANRKLQPPCEREI